MKKHIKLITIPCILLFLVVIGCDVFQPKPEDVLLKYLEANSKGKYGEAYNLVSSKDKLARSVSDYEFKEKTDIENPFDNIFTSKTSYKIKEVTITSNEAVATVDVTMVDFAEVLQNFIGELLLTAFDGKEDKYDLEKMVAEEYKNKELPTITVPETFTLIKEKSGWKVFLDWGTKDKVENMMAQAKQLEDDKKLYAAKDKYQEVLQLDSREVAASVKLEKVDKEIESYEEKQVYINKVELYDLSAGYYKTYSDDRVAGVDFKLKNKGDRTLSKVEVTVYFKDANGNVIAEEDYHPILVSSYSFGDNKPLKPNYIWQQERGTFLRAKSVPNEWKEGDAFAKITDIEFQE